MSGSESALRRFRPQDYNQHPCTGNAWGRSQGWNPWKEAAIIYLKNQHFICWRIRSMAIRYWLCEGGMPRFFRITVTVWLFTVKKLGVKCWWHTTHTRIKKSLFVLRILPKTRVRWSATASASGALPRTPYPSDWCKSDDFFLGGRAFGGWVLGQQRFFHSSCCSLLY